MIIRLFGTVTQLPYDKWTGQAPGPSLYTYVRIWICHLISIDFIMSEVGSGCSTKELANQMINRQFGTAANIYFF